MENTYGFANMIELDFFSGRLGNCMFQYAFGRCLADALHMQYYVPKGTEITGFPNIYNDSIHIHNHLNKYIVYDNYHKNLKTQRIEHDNTMWFVEPQFNGKKIQYYDEHILLDKILAIKNINQKYIILCGNFEIGYQYKKYRDIIKSWFSFPYIDLKKIEFFKLHPDLGKNNNYYVRDFVDLSQIYDKDNLFISLRLEDYTYNNNKDRLLTYDYFKIIIEHKKWKNIYIMTNPCSIGHNDEYKYIKEFYPYNPTFIRCYDPVMSMAFCSKYKNIAISQSTYSWWIAFLSNAATIFYPIPKYGPFSLFDKNYLCSDLRIDSPEFIYVDYESQTILPDDFYTKIDYKNKQWTN